MRFARAFVPYGLNKKDILYKLFCLMVATMSILDWIHQNDSCYCCCGCLIVQGKVKS